MDEGHPYVNIALFHTGKVNTSMFCLFHEYYACQLKLPVGSFSLTEKQNYLHCTHELMHSACLLLTISSSGNLSRAYQAKVSPCLLHPRIKEY